MAGPSSTSRAVSSYKHVEWSNWLAYLVHLAGAGGYGRQKQTEIWRTARYNLVYQHPSDWHNNEGVTRQAEAPGDEDRQSCFVPSASDGASALRTGAGLIQQLLRALFLHELPPSV